MITYLNDGSRSSPYLASESLDNVTGTRIVYYLLVFVYCMAVRLQIVF